MSGGFFQYRDYWINEISDTILQEIYNSGREIPSQKLDYWDKERGRTLYYEYKPEVIEELKRAVYILKKAQIYAHRIDYLLSGDDDEDSFISRLNNELDFLDKQSTDEKINIDMDSIHYDEESESYTE